MGSVPSILTTIGMASGVIDDETVEKAAMFLLENPEIAMRVQQAYTTIATKKGLGGGAGYSPGLR